MEEKLQSVLCVSLLFLPVSPVFWLSFLCPVISLFYRQISNVLQIPCASMLLLLHPPLSPSYFFNGAVWDGQRMGFAGRMGKKEKKKKGVRERERGRWKKFFFFLLFCFSFLVPGFVFLFARMAPLPFYLSNWSLVVFCWAWPILVGFFVVFWFMVFFVDQSPFSIFFVL